MIDTTSDAGFRERGPVAVDDNGCEHPAWCSPQHCYVTDEGVRVHQQAPTRWDAECVVPLRFETCLIDPADDDTTYLELHIMRNLKPRNQFYGLLPLDTVRQLRNQLTEHLDAVTLPSEPPGPDQLCPESDRGSVR